MLGQVQRMAVKQAKILKNVAYEKWCWELGLFSLEKAKGIPYHFPHLHEGRL